MKKPVLLPFFLFFIILLSACGRAQLEAQKKLLVPAKDLQQLGNLPDSIFFDKQFDKLTVTYKSTKAKQLIEFYDTEGGAPVPFFETSYADEVIRPQFGQNFSLAYALREKSAWQLYIRTFVAPDPLPVIAAANLIDFIVSDPAVMRLISIVREGNLYKVQPAPFKDVPLYLQVSDLKPYKGNKFVYRALKQDGSWIVFDGTQESEPFTFVSALAANEAGDLGFIARGDKNQWFAVVNGEKTPLKKIYQEVGQIFLSKGKIVFSANEKGKDTWGIARNTVTLEEGFTIVPKFIVRENEDLAIIGSAAEGKAHYRYGRTVSADYNQVDQLIEDGEGTLFAKVKNKFALWQVVSEDEHKSDQYVWMSDVYVDKRGDVFFVGLTSNSDFEFYKFHNK